MPAVFARWFRIPSAEREKKHSEILAAQMLSQVFYGVGTIVLKGYSSTVQNAVATAISLIRERREVPSVAKDD